jgi:GMP synthase (glutamine-hydrolysing)
MNIHFIVHEHYEGPGYFLEWATKHLYTVTTSRIYLNEALPEKISEIDCLIVLGGPQNPKTTKNECSYFDAVNEIRFISQCIERGKVVVGICLGAQLIGEAMGGKYESSPNKEIGYFPIKLNEIGLSHSKFKHFNSIETVGHWHNDMPGLTQKSRVLASSDGCQRQIVEYAKLVYGFQCHLEFTAQTLKILIENSETEFIHYKDHQYIQCPEKILAKKTTHMNFLMSGFMDALIHDYLSE